MGNEETEAKRDEERQRCLETETRTRDIKRWRYLEIEADRWGNKDRERDPLDRDNCISRPGSVPTSHTSGLGGVHK